MPCRPIGQVVGRKRDLPDIRLLPAQGFALVERLIVVNCLVGSGTFCADADLEDASPHRGYGAPQHCNAGAHAYQPAVGPAPYRNGGAMDVRSTKESVLAQRSRASEPEKPPRCCGSFLRLGLLSYFYFFFFFGRRYCCARGFVVRPGRRHAWLGDGIVLRHGCIPIHSVPSACKHATNWPAHREVHLGPLGRGLGALEPRATGPT